MDPSNIRYAQRIGRRYAITAAVVGIGCLLLLVEIIGVALIGYNPIFLLRDLIYIYNYAFYAGVLMAVFLSYLLGASAGQRIATKPTNPTGIGVSFSFSVFISSITVSLVVMCIKRSQSDIPMELSVIISGLAQTYLTLFFFGCMPTWIAGYVYGKAVSRKIDKGPSASYS